MASYEDIAYGLPAYREFRPTSFDIRGLGCDDQQHWKVLPVGRNRDSGILAESNFETAVSMLPEDGHEVHSFNHWGCGWFEIILIDPDNCEAMRIAGEITSAIEVYPVLDEEDYSRREWEAAQEAWEYMALRDRIETATDAGLSMFAARRDDVPSECIEALV
jgi:hypothetical protein